MSDRAFAISLRHHRRQARLSQSRLALLAGFDHSYISRLESGTRRPTRQAVTALGNTLQLSPVDMDGLLAAAGFMPGDVENLIAVEPIIVQAFAVLRDIDVAEDAKADLRASIALLVRQARRTSAGSMPA